MNTSCYGNATTSVILAFYIIGCLLSIIGTLLNLCSCLLFCRAKSLHNMPYAVFIIALSVADIVKLTAEYFVHLLFIYVEHPYFVCSITWFLTMTSENTSYAFLCALGKYNAIVIYLFVISNERDMPIDSVDAIIVMVSHSEVEKKKKSSVK
jgi:hypothetical protein